MRLHHKNILLIITGGIAAYKSLELIRRLRDEGASVRAILTAGGAQFITPLAVAALCEQPCYTELFSLKDEAEMGHIRLAREAELIIVAPASADFIAKAAHGLADDLASTCLLASHAPLLLAPAMNPSMWAHAATQDNFAKLLARGAQAVGPDVGAMACNEQGAGRLADIAAIVDAACAILQTARPLLGQALLGRRALVTSGPTREPIDPVRYISNHSSGKQGHAIAAALAQLGAEVTLITGPVNIANPQGCKIVPVESAQEMLSAAQAALPADIIICAAAVADWRIDNSSTQKIKKTDGAAPTLSLTPNPDILATLCNATPRAKLIIGFAAETENVEAYARAKLARKGCDWLLANDVSQGSGTFGGDLNKVILLQKNNNDISADYWPQQSKTALAQQLAQSIAKYFQT